MYLLSSVGHLHGLHLLHHLLGCHSDAGRHVLNELCDPVHISLDVLLQRHGLWAWGGKLLFSCRTNHSKNCYSVLVLILKQSEIYVLTIGNSQQDEECGSDGEFHGCGWAKPTWGTQMSQSLWLISFLWASQHEENRTDWDSPSLERGSKVCLVRESQAIYSCGQWAYHHCLWFHHQCPKVETWQGNKTYAGWTLKLDSRHKKKTQSPPVSVCVASILRLWLLVAIYNLFLWKSSILFFLCSNSASEKLESLVKILFGNVW